MGLILIAFFIWNDISTRNSTIIGPEIKEIRSTRIDDQ